MTSAVEGGTGKGLVTVTAMWTVMYEGLVHQPSGRAGLVQASGAMLVLVSADRFLDDAAVSNYFAALSATQRVAAHGQPPDSCSTVESRPTTVKRIIAM